MDSEECDRKYIDLVKNTSSRLYDNMPHRKANIITYWLDVAKYIGEKNSSIISKQEKFQKH